MNTIKIYREGKTYYYEYENETEVIDIFNIEKLVNRVKLPFKIKFKNLSVAQRDKIISKFLSTEVTYQITNVEGNEIEFLFSKMKHTIHAYAIPSKVCLEGRSEITKPYVLRTIGDQKILMEVTKDYIRNSDEQYYFLYAELSEKERTFFDPVYRKLECDYVYQLAYQMEKTQTLERRKRK